MIFVFLGDVVVKYFSIVVNIFNSVVVKGFEGEWINELFLGFFFEDFFEVFCDVKIFYRKKKKKLKKKRKEIVVLKFGCGGFGGYLRSLRLFGVVLGIFNVLDYW